MYFELFLSINLSFSQADFISADERYSLIKNFIALEFFPTSGLFLINFLNL